MHKFEYDVRLNDLGAPYVHLPKKMKVETEDKFMFLEMSRMTILNILDSIAKKKMKKKKTLSDEDAKKLVKTFNVLTTLADEVGLLLKAQKEIEDELGDFLSKNEDE